MFTIYCIECGDEVGTTTCKITATSMTLCEPCQDAERGEPLNPEGDRGPNYEPDTDLDTDAFDDWREEVEE